MSEARTSVLILGGGFSGSAVARGLGRQAAVTVVSRDNFLLFTPMLAEAAVGDVDPRHIVTPIRQLAPHADLVQGEITEIDPHKKRIVLNPVFGSGSMTIDADVLVIALGSIPHTYGVAGVEGHALAFKEIGDALRIRNRMLALLETASHHPDPMLTRVAVVGAGYSGAELGAALGDFLGEVAARFYRAAPTPQVTLVDAVDRVTPALPTSLSDSAARALNARGVSLALGSPVSEVTERGVRLENGNTIEAATVVWAAGVRPNPILTGLGLPLENGKLVVDGHLRVSRGVYAVGDAALAPAGGGGMSPPTAQFALRQGRYLGRHLMAIEADATGVPEFSYTTKGELVSLGHRNAVGKVLGFPVSGLLGWFLWRSYYLLQLPTFLRKARVALDWTLDVIFPPDVAWIPSSDLGPPRVGP
ncbi:MAG: NAD(P)/FAD-dependent oxidoreductase [Acidimicrobiia bacterium]